MHKGGEGEQSLLDNRQSTLENVKGRDRSEYAYANIEMLAQTRLQLSYCIWITALIVALLGLVPAATYGFKCVPFCDMGNAAPVCVSDGWIATGTGETCLPQPESARQDQWRSAGLIPSSFEVGSLLRRFNRLVVAMQRVQNTSDIHVPPTIDCLDHDGHVLSTIHNPDIDILSQGRKLIMSLPSDRAALPVGTSGFRVNWSPGSNPYAHVDPSLMSVYYLSEDPAFVKFKVVFRYLTIFVGIVVAIEFFYLHSKRVALSDQEASGLSRMGVLFRGSDYRALTLEHRFALGFHFLVVLSANPLCYWTSMYSGGDSAWRYLGQNFFPLLRTISVAAAGITGYTIMGSMAKLGRNVKVIVIRCIFLSLLFVIPEIALDTLAAHDGEPSLSSTIQTTKYGVGTLVLQYLWTTICILIFWRLRNQMVYNSGISGFYFGRVRILALWLRVVMGYFTIYLVFSAGLLTPLLITLSTIVPLNESANFIDIVLTNVLSATALLLFAPNACEPSRAPPNPSPMYSKASAQGASSSEMSTRGLIAPASTMKLGYGSSGETTPEQDGVGEGGGNRNSESVVVELRHRWKHITWTPKHFLFARQHLLSGFAFYTEAEEAAFAARHAGVNLARSFFVWETAFAMLNLSAEVYFDHQGETVLGNQQVSCCESCLRKCCGAENDDSDNDEVDENGEDPTAAVSQQSLANALGANRRVAARAEQAEQEADDHDESPLTSSSSKRKPTSPTDQNPPEPMMDVTKHGYDLYRCIIVKGVQVLICTHNLTVDGQEACKPREVGGTFRQHRNPHIAIVFRGTANATNMVTDANFLRSQYDEMMVATRNKAQVHAGFYNVWLSLRAPLFEHLDKLFGSLKTTHPDHRFPVLVTGHSLGGALATLCHYSIAAGGGMQFVLNRMSYCRSYTYGMPRVGNQSFVNEFNAKCRESYRVVRENDAVTRMGICGREHVGHSVSVDRDGNCIVEPNAVEKVYNVLAGSGSVLRNHSLDRYAESFDIVMKAQTQSEEEASKVTVTTRSSAGPKKRPGEAPLPHQMNCFGFRSYVAGNLEAEIEAGALEGAIWKEDETELGSRQASQATQQRQRTESAQHFSMSSRRLKERTVTY